MGLDLYFVFSDQISILFRILLALFLGFLIGAERELVNKEAGTKTYSLVSVGATLFTILSLDPLFPDNSRMIAQIIVGIGFIGAGLIIFHENKVHGLTTAAGLWVIAAVGVAVGMRYYFTAIVGTLVMFIILYVFRKIKVEERVRNLAGVSEDFNERNS